VIRAQWISDAFRFAQNVAKLWRTTAGESIWRKTPIDSVAGFDPVKPTALLVTRGTHTHHEVRKGTNETADRDRIDYGLYAP
jgi:hypothetical protein